MGKDEKKSAGGGGKLMRSETVTVRLDPKLRYLAELAALKHRRTLSSFVEWAIEDSLKRVKLRDSDGFNDDHGTSIADETSNLWDVDDADRFAKLALRYPELLTHEEQKRWKVIRENSWVWKGNYGPNNRWKWTVDESKLNFARLREHWDDFLAVARGEKDSSVLPTVADKTDSSAAGQSRDLDEDIPF